MTGHKKYIQISEKNGIVPPYITYIRTVNTTTAIAKMQCLSLYAEIQLELFTGEIALLY